jgi:DnaJ-class molecular chaperone
MQHSEKNLYSILEVSRHNSALEIRQSYKKLSKKLHPDKNPSPDAELMFQQVKVAYDVRSLNKPLCTFILLYFDLPIISAL